MAHLRKLLKDSAAGARLPSLSQLAADWGITQVTASRVYAKLIATGDVIARRFEGYYKPDPSRLIWQRNVSRSWAAAADDAGHSHASADLDPEPPVTTAATTVGGYSLATLLGVPPDTVLTVRRDVRHIGPADGDPVAPEGFTSTYRLHTPPGDEGEPVEHTEIVIARLATEAEAAALDLQPPTPVAEVVRTSYAAASAAVQVEHTITLSRLGYLIRQQAASGSTSG
uniref:hypothetical protein n=1 Tax=Nonomuraea sp. CA-251285 TaxID=3240002 RepID=UPI003F499EAC